MWGRWSSGVCVCGEVLQQSSIRGNSPSPLEFPGGTSNHNCGSVPSDTTSPPTRALTVSGSSINWWCNGLFRFEPSWQIYESTDPWYYTAGLHNAQVTKIRLFLTFCVPSCASPDFQFWLQLNKYLGKYWDSNFGPSTFRSHDLWEVLRADCFI